MKKRLAVLVFFTAVVFSCAAAYPATDDVIEGMGKKLLRGLVNTFTGWVEFPAQIVKGWNNGIPGDEDNKLLGVVVGVFDGIGHSLGRTGWGVLELAGFWTANPEDNEGIGVPLDAEYAWEEGEAYDCFDPSFYDATIEPMGRKLLRGIGNGVFGFVEFPGQIAKGVQEGAPDLGIIKGLWFWASREVYGIGEVVTAILPAPEDNPGYPFDEEYPWDALAESLEQ